MASNLFSDIGVVLTPLFESEDFLKHFFGVCVSLPCELSKISILSTLYQGLSSELISAKHPNAPTHLF